MPQDRASGAAGRAYGLMMARGLARLLGATLVRADANEIRWDGRVGVIKSCAPHTDQIGVTASMLPRLDVILAGFENEAGHVDVFELDAQRFRTAMYDSRSAAGPKLQMVRRRYAEAAGRQIAHYPIADVLRAAEDALGR